MAQKITTLLPVIISEMTGDSLDLTLVMPHILQRLSDTEGLVLWVAQTTSSSSGWRGNSIHPHPVQA